MTNWIRNGGIVTDPNFNASPTPGTGAKIAKGCGYGCGAVFLFALFMIGVFTGNFGNFIVFVVIGIFVFVLVNASKRSKNYQPTIPGAIAPPPAAPQAAQSETQPATISSNLAVSGINPLREGFLQSPLCIHSFSEDGFDSKNRVVCPCGYNFKKSDLEEYRQLIQLRESVEAKIVTLRENIRISAQSDAAVSSRGSNTNPSIAPIPSKQKKPKASKPKVVLSLQQWLIIGAAALVIVAGSVFVSTNIDTLPQWAFQLITAGIAAVTAFGALRLKQVSVILSNFLALFSSAMQLATLTIVADQLDSSFIWPNLTFAWWAFALGSVSILALVLSKFTRNFGWKAIAVLGITGTGLVFVMGAMREWLQYSDFVFSLTLIAFTAFMLAQIVASRYLRELKSEVTKGASAAYEKDLAEREDNALRRYALSAVSLFVLISIGYAVYISGFSPELAKNLWEPWTTILFGVIWVALAKFPRFWASDLSPDGKFTELFEKIAWVVGYSAIALGISRLASMSESAWVNLAINVIGVTALILLPKFAKKLPVEVIAIDFAIWFSFVTGLLWTTSSWNWDDEFGGFFMVAYAAVLTLAYWAHGRNYLSIASSASGNLGAIWLLANVALKADANQTVAITALGLLAFVNVLPALQARVARLAKNDYQERAQQIVALISSAIIVVILIGEAGLELGDSIWILLSLFTYQIAAYTSSQRKLRSGSNQTFATGEVHSIMAQLGILFVAGRALSFSQSTSTLLGITLILLALALANYCYSLFAKRGAFALVGYVFANLAGISAVHQLGPHLDSTVLVLLLAVLTAAIPLVHQRISKLVPAPNAIRDWSIPVIGSGVLMLGGLIKLASSELQVDYRLLGQAMWLSVAVLAASTVAATVGFEFFKKKKNVGGGSLALGLAGIYSVGNVLFVILTTGQLLSENLIATLLNVTVVTLAATVVARAAAHYSLTGLVLAGFALNFVVGLNVSVALQRVFENDYIPELLALSVAASLVASAFIYSKQLGAGKILTIDIAVVASLAYSAITCLAFGFGDGTVWIRGIIELVLLSAYSYLRAVGRKSLPWLIAGYLSGIASAFLIVRELDIRLKLEWAGLEHYSLGVIGSMLLGNYLLAKIRKVKSVDFRFGLPLLVLVAPMALTGILAQFGTLEGSIRISLGLLIPTAYSYWRTSANRKLSWLISGYVLGGLSAWSVTDAIHQHLLPRWDGPEVLSVLLTSSIFIGHRHLRLVTETKNTILLWGLPTAALILPSALYTATTSSLSFTDLNAEQVVRAAAVLLAAAIAVLAGTRSGNRGLAYSGVAGLAVIGWVHAALVTPWAVVEFRSIVIGAILLTALTALRNAGKIRGNSLVWLGIPIAVAMTPAIFNTLAALANPELNTVDWWRFGIVVGASIVLLVAGSLREVAGMFFPGLIGVVLAALPYGFKRVQQESWFLWVLLLLIAGIMVWVAVRMDQLRKQGKSSATWLKELK